MREWEEPEIYTDHYILKATVQDHMIKQKTNKICERK